jgi:hypothetical protein
MKRTATTLALLAGFGGGCMSTDGPTALKPIAQKQAPARAGGYGTVTRPVAAPGFQGPTGEPVAMIAARGSMTPTVVTTDMAKTNRTAMGVMQAGGPMTTANTVVRAHVPSMAALDSKVVQANGTELPPGFPPRGGILPVPGMGPPGAVAAVGAINPGMRPVVSNQRTSVRFTGPAGMKITWQLPGGGFNDETSGLTAPADYNFLQAQIYRLRLARVLPNFPGRTFYPTLEIAPVSPKTLTFLAHASVPVTFTDEDFRQAADGNLVVKVIYLPDPAFQDFATVAGAEEIVSTRLEPGADPVAEAQKRGTILATIRLGNIDLENRASPAMTAVPAGPLVVPPMMVPPGVPAVPGGVAPALPVPVPPKLPSSVVPQPMPGAGAFGSPSGIRDITAPVAPVKPATPAQLPTAVKSNGPVSLPLPPTR